MDRQLQKLLEKQRELEDQIAAAKKREAFGRRLLEMARKAGVLEIEDPDYWQDVFAKAVARKKPAAPETKEEEGELK